MNSSTIEALLGGPEILGQEIETEMDLYELGRGGIPKKSLIHLARSLNTDLRNGPLEASSFWTLGQARGELPTSSTSHFPVGVWAPMLVSLRHSCV